MIEIQRAIAAIVISVALPACVFAQTKDFFNVLAASDSADAFVFQSAMRRSSMQYYMISIKHDSIMLSRSHSLLGLGSGERKLVWQQSKSGSTCKNLRSPEMHRVNNKWYIYVSADDGREDHRRIYVMESNSPDPFFGEFVLKGKLVDPLADNWATDPTLLILNSRLFLIWSGLAGKENVRTNLYIAPMSDPHTLAASRIEIARPQFSWERKGADRKHQMPETNESPELLIRANLIHIVYSAGLSSPEHACVGLLTAKITDDPLRPASWRKTEQPVFSGGSGLHGLGQFSFVKSPDGTEDWMVYCASPNGSDDSIRQIRTQPYFWDNGPVPQFGQPSLPNTAIPLPHGESARMRYEAENATFGGTSRVYPYQAASGSAKVGRILTPQSFVDFTVTASAAGKYDLIVRYANGSEHNRTASHEVIVNDTSVGEIVYPATGPDNWSNAFLTAELKQGKNLIRFRKSKETAEIDCIDVTLIPNFH